MQKLFNRILVPVDFSPKSKIAVGKAVAIAQQYECDLHLLHVAPVVPFSSLAIGEGHLMAPYGVVDDTKSVMIKLREFSDYGQSRTGSKLNIQHACRTGTWNQAVIDYVGENNMDLVVIGQKSGLLGKRKMILNPDVIAERTSIPVITLPANRRLTHLYSIVIPVTEFLPVKKLMYGIYIASKYSTTIKLLAVENEKSHAVVQHYLKKAYQLIRDNCNINVELETVRNNNVAAAIIEFAKQHSADLIILNPGTQTRMPGFFSTLLGRFIQKYSAPPVLTVAPLS